MERLIDGKIEAAMGELEERMDGKTKESLKHLQNELKEELRGTFQRMAGEGHIGEITSTRRPADSSTSRTERRPSADVLVSRVIVLCVHSIGDTGVPLLQKSFLV